MDQETHSIRFIAKIIGKINATEPGNQYAPLLTKNMEAVKIDALRNHKFNYEANMALSNDSAKDLMYLSQNLSSSSAPVRQPQPDYVIYTDASNKGWGCYDPQTGNKFGGRWDFQEETHINRLELKASWGRHWRKTNAHSAHYYYYTAGLANSGQGHNRSTCENHDRWHHCLSMHK